MLPVIETFTEDMKQVNTLLQLATATRNILQKLTIKDIQVITLPDNYFKFKFITEDGSTIETNAVFIGEAISIDNVLSTISTNPVQNKIITEAINTINTSITALQGTSLSNAEKEFVSSEYTKTQGPAGAVMHKENVEGDVLWENASPASPFGASTLAIADYTGYSKLLFIVKLNNSLTQIRVGLLFDLSSGTTGALSLVDYVGGVHTREFTILSSTSISITDGKVVTSAGESSTTSYAMVPVAIYGIK